MSVAKIMPARTQAEPAIVDIDEILSVATTIKVNHKTYTLSHLTVRNAAELEQARIKVLNVGDVRDFEQVCEVYFEFISKICPSMKLEDLKELSLVQLHKLFKVIVRHMRAEMSGRTLYEEQLEEDEKKKNQAVTA